MKLGIYGCNPLCSVLFKMTTCFGSAERYRGMCPLPRRPGRSQ